MQPNNKNSVIEKAKSIILKKNDEILFLRAGLKAAMGGKEPILLKMPGELRVENFPDVQKVKIENADEPQKVKVTNLGELKVSGLNLKFPKVQDVRVVSDEKTSKWVPTLITHAVKAVMDGISKRIDMGVKVRVEDEDKLRPQAVIIVDVTGKPVDFARMAGGGGMIVPMTSGGGVTKPPTTINSGRKTVTVPGTAEQLVSSITVARQVIVTAPATNSDAVYLGGSTVSAVAGSEQGLLLNPTGSASIDIDDVSKIWIDSVVAGEGVTFTYIR